MLLKLQQAVDRYIEDVCLGKTNETPRAYRNKLNRMIDYFGNCRVTSVKAEDLEAFKRHMVSTEQKHRGKQSSRSDSVFSQCVLTCKLSGVLGLVCAQETDQNQSSRRILPPKEPTYSTQSA